MFRLASRVSALLPLAVFLVIPSAAPARAEGLGYYRFPTVHAGVVVFTAEGDLWRVPIQGGVAQRLTSHLAEESRAAFSPDGRWLAFSAAYDGPVEVYVMPAEGGAPSRLTWDGARDNVVGWTPSGEVVYSTRRTSTLPATRLFTVRPGTGLRTPVPLAQAAEGVWSGRRLFFTRMDFQGSYTKRYRGGTVQQLWTWEGGRDEARRLFPGDSAASRSPMLWGDRLVFVGDRDLTMNLWSCRLDGSDLRQHTHHRDFDVQGASLADGQVVYQLGADLRVLDLARGEDRAIPIRLASDFDQMREHWIASPLEFATAFHLSPDGDRVAITARGQVFVLPAREGRIAAATHRPAVRYRQARFLPDGRSLLALSDESGEVEFCRLPANGVGDPAALTHDGRVLRWDGVPSPDGKWVAHWDKNQELWLLEVASGHDTRIAVSEEWGDFQDVAWSPDSRWLAYVRPAPNLLLQILLYDVERHTHTAVTTDRWDSYSPAFSPDGRWLWFLSDRTFRSLVPSIWGSRQPDPYFDRSTEVLGLSLRASYRSPFAAPDELHPEGGGDADTATAATKKGSGAARVPSSVSSIELDGLASRLIQVPVEPGNYSTLSTDGKALYWLDAETSADRKQTLEGLAIQRKREDPKTVLADVAFYELSANRKKILVRKKDALYVIDAAPRAPDKLEDDAVPLKDWSFTVDPRTEWRQIFTEAWRLERDYFYDRALHGVDWKAMLEKYRPLAERVTDRAEMNDVFGQMIGELSALHMFVRGGDLRRGLGPAEPASLGARLEPVANGARIAQIWRTDPDLPGRLSPLASPDLGIREGDVILAINGVALTAVPDPEVPLRQQADRQVLLRIQRPGAAARDVIVKPFSPARDLDLRYASWEYGRRLRTDSLSHGRIGYVHMRSMGSNDMAQWVRDYYPVFQRDGLVIDMRNNTGGNIDSWILGKLLRKVWFYWQPRVGHPVGNMPFAFRGKMAVLVNENTASDGEAFAEGFRRLGLGPVIGTRTWGGEIWLSADNFLVDRGIATAAETGVYGLEGSWLIEGHGVDPDQVVDNLPRATYDGADDQLDAAVRTLLESIDRQPAPVVAAPRYPDKAAR